MSHGILLAQIISHHNFQQFELFHKKSLTKERVIEITASFKNFTIFCCFCCFTTIVLCSIGFFLMLV